MYCNCRRFCNRQQRNSTYACHFILSFSNCQCKCYCRVNWHGAIDMPGVYSRDAYFCCCRNWLRNHYIRMADQCKREFCNCQRSDFRDLFASCIEHYYYLPEKNRFFKWRYYLLLTIHITNHHNRYRTNCFGRRAEFGLPVSQPNRFDINRCKFWRRHNCGLVNHFRRRGFEFNCPDCKSVGSNLYSGSKLQRYSHFTTDDKCRQWLCFHR